MKAIITGLALLPVFSFSLAATPTASIATTPLQAVMAERHVVNQPELSDVSLVQTLNRPEGATEATITLIESNLLDDSVAAVKNVFFLKRNDTGWAIDQVHSFQKCRRGADTERFTQKRCP
ncbi:MAG: hypothetical protein KBC57_04710 [Neisseriaceae bacterium]|nr:hypothetical protein [Neisseriaceae bacterium]MBP6861642.1 hypothetical protein [Neisseriaceae bacterium]